LRWADEVDNDVKALGERNWKNIARNWQIWQTLLRKAMAQKGLFCQWWYCYTLGQVFFKHFNANHHSTNDPYSYVSDPETCIRVYQPVYFIKTLDISFGFISDPTSA
jgi:hypothetical protein